ncbi:unnamed protein product, partial [Didymodactylos carnosus]
TGTSQEKPFLANTTNNETTRVLGRSLPSAQGDFGTDLADTSGHDVLVGKAPASASNPNVEANTECEFDETSAQNLGSAGSRHSSIRKRAADLS